MEKRKIFLEKLTNARRKIALKLEEGLEAEKNFKLYPIRLAGSYIDVLPKNGEILVMANEKFRELFDRVDFEKISQAKADKYRLRYKTTYDNCHEAIKSNGNISLNAALVGVIGPLISPDMISNGYWVYHEFYFAVEELLEFDSTYFANLKNYGDEHISINDLAKLIFNIEEKNTSIRRREKDEEEELEDGDMEQLTYSRNKILFGPPGAGKSYSITMKLNMVNVKEKNITRITFHPEYSYYEFVGQYKPVVGYEKIAGDNIRYHNSSKLINEKAFVYYDFVAGPFTKSIINALKLGEAEDGMAPENALLIIEEINRGNSSAIFGDIFQLLDRINDVNSDDYGESEYSIDISVEMKEYIKKELNWDEEKWSEKFKRGFIIPSNLYIYSTMNTSDQSLYPMDSAFKRRWDMEYIYINYKESKLSDLYLPEPYEEIKWLDFIKSANEEIVVYTGVDDKQLGQWFVGNSLSSSEFIGKVISYLWFDIFRHDPGIIFKEEIKTFDDIRKLYGKGIFNKEFIGKIDRLDENINDGAVMDE